MKEERGTDRRLLDRVEFFVHQAVDDRRLTDRRFAKRDNPEQVRTVVKVHLTIGRTDSDRNLLNCVRHFY